MSNTKQRNQEFSNQLDYLVEEYENDAGLYEMSILLIEKLRYVWAIDLIKDMNLTKNLNKREEIDVMSEIEILSDEYHTIINQDSFLHEVNTIVNTKIVTRKLKVKKDSKEDRRNNYAI